MNKEIYNKLKLMEKDYLKQDFIDTLRYIVAEETIKQIEEKEDASNN